jgi:uncharacterized protein YqjF (DUF2071 family)
MSEARGGYATQCVNLVDFLSTPARQHATLDETGHRPWPLPGGSWLMAQTWDDLLFAHWAVPAAAVREHVPPELPVDTFDGAAWVGVTPFRLTGLRLRAVPPAPFLSTFLELNARTYVTLGGKPGIWFFSLDAASRLAVAAARRAYRLPYFHARMSAEPDDEGLCYASERVSAGERPAEFAARYAATGEVSRAAPGSLEHFLTERYCLYAVEGGRVFRAEIHHRPWPLQSAVAELERNTMPPPGIPIEGEPLLHYAGRQDVVIWPLTRLEDEGRTA